MCSNMKRCYNVLNLKIINDEKLDQNSGPPQNNWFCFASVMIFIFGSYNYYISLYPKCALPFQVHASNSVFTSEFS